MNNLRCSTSVGELLDKISILKIKLERINDGDKLKNIRKELANLEKELQYSIDRHGFLYYIEKLKAVNSVIWDCVDRLSYMINNSYEEHNLADYNAEFAAMARAIFENNNNRYLLKKQANEDFDSEIKEEKSFSLSN